MRYPLFCFLFTYDYALITALLRYWLLHALYIYYLLRVLRSAHARRSVSAFSPPAASLPLLLSHRFPPTGFLSPMSPFPLLRRPVNGHPKIITLLREKLNASLSVEKKESRYTALCYACYTGHAQCVQVRRLLEACCYVGNRKMIGALAWRKDYLQTPLNTSATLAAFELHHLLLVLTCF